MVGDIQQDMQEALRLFQDGRAEEAQALVAGVLRRAPDDPRIHMVYGKMLRQTGHIDEALARFEMALSIDPTLHEAHVNVGDICLLSADYSAAVSAYGHALEGGANATLYNKLGTALEASGDVSGAKSSFRSALDLDAQHAPALSNLGTLLVHENRFREAQACFEKALQAKPDYARAAINLGLLYKQAGRLADALGFFEQALKTNPGDPALITYRGSILQALGRLDEAEACFQSVLDTDPLYTDALACYAELMEWRGNYEAAAQLLEPHMRNGNQDPTLALAYARVLKSMDQPDKALAVLEPFLEIDGARPHWYAQLLFTVAQLLDQSGQHERALDVVARANEMSSLVYEPEYFANLVTSLIDFFSRERIANLPRATGQSGGPVFIVGMPRSGTSLVEQILAAHGDVFAMGESPAIGQLAVELGFGSNTYPESLTALDREQMTELAQQYLSSLSSGYDAASCFTDKMPLNFLHLGLIQLLFPNARIVHCRRHPLDVCVSCYFQDFIDPALAFSTRQDWLAHYWLQYDRLMRHWTEVLALESFALRYEDLIADTESVVRALVSFLDLDWDPACLEFYENRRLVHTASHAQVDRPIYVSAVGRASRLGAGLKELRRELAQSVDAYESESDNARP